MGSFKIFILLLAIKYNVDAKSIYRYPRESSESKIQTPPELIEDTPTESKIQTPLERTTVPTLAVEGKGENETEDLSGRFNLNFGQSASQAFGPGGASNSLSGSRTVNVGLVGPYGSSYTPLHRDSQSFSHTNRFGYNAPQTWAGSGGRYGGPGSNGYGSSGFRGGIGNSNSQAFNVQQRIPIGNGLTLLSNLNTGEPESPVADAAPVPSP